MNPKNSTLSSKNSSKVSVGSIVAQNINQHRNTVMGHAPVVNTRSAYGIIEVNNKGQANAGGKSGGGQ